MLELIDGLIFYHGSYCEVRQPEVRYGAKYKDFGQGFYLTSSKKQARNFIQTSVKKAGLSGRIETQQNYGYVSSYRFTPYKKLNIQIYPTADTNWLHCIVAHRRKNTFPVIFEEMKKYDIIGGKIANDNTNFHL